MLLRLAEWLLGELPELLLLLPELFELLLPELFELLLPEDFELLLPELLLPELPELLLPELAIWLPELPELFSEPRELLVAPRLPALMLLLATGAAGPP